jgi:uncharacterized protein YycO
MELKLLDIVIYYGHLWNPLTYVVGVRTSTFWTHAGIVLSTTGLCMEAKEGGVQKTLLNQKRKHKIIRYNGELTEEEQYKLMCWLLSKEGCGYEYKSYIGYLFGFKTPYLNDPNEFVCVELASEMFYQNDIDIWGCEKPTYVYPSDMLQNPFFDEVI